MRLFAPAMILSLATMLLGTDWPASVAQAKEYQDSRESPDSQESEVYQASGKFADEVAVPCQEGCQGSCQQSCGCECHGKPGVLASIFDRFLNPCECDPHWSFSADAVGLQRGNARSQALFRDTNDTVDVLNASHLDSSAAMGFQLGAIRHGPCGWDVEFGYFQIDGWAANSTLSDETLMMTGVDDSYYVTDGVAEYKSAIHLAEINVRWQWFDGMTLLAGFRTGELNELYSAYGIGARNPVPISLNVNTFNHLYGFQLGADYEFYNMGGPLRISSLCKAGIYGNSASQSSRLIEAGESDQTLAANRNQAAFIGETGAVATYQVTRRLSLRASCQAVWIEGVALAPEQISENDFTGGVATIDTHGGIFYYGGGLGAELKF
jgi:hypothetical protein